MSLLVSHGMWWADFSVCLRSLSLLYTSWLWQDVRLRFSFTLMNSGALRLSSCSFSCCFSNCNTRHKPDKDIQHSIREDSGRMSHSAEDTWFCVLPEQGCTSHFHNRLKRCVSMCVCYLLQLLVSLEKLYFQRGELAVSFVFLFPLFDQLISPPRL